MKRTTLHTIIGVILLLVGIAPTSAQQVNSLYFLDNTPHQHQFNPAIQPLQEGYFSLPVLGYGQLSAGNNSLTLKNILFRPKGSSQYVTFLHPEYGDKDKFYKRIHQNTLLSANYHINLLAFGFRFKEKNYFMFNITERIESGIGLPKDLFKLLLYGTPEISNNNYKLKNLGLSASIYTEIGAGASFIHNEKFQTGFKLKFLLGHLNANFYNKDLALRAGIDEWLLHGNATLRTSSPLLISNGFESITTPSTLVDYIKPSGYGGAIDFGIVYNIKKNLRLTAAITDLGFIYWNRQPVNSSTDINYAFQGVEFDGSDLLNGFDGQLLLDTLKSGITRGLNLNNITQYDENYFAMTTAKLNIGFDWTFCKDKLGIGILSRTMLLNRRVYEEITASFKVRPVDWFNMNLSYSMLNGRGSLGAGIGLSAGPIHFFVAADYIPLAYSTYNKAPIPYNSPAFNLAGGISIVWGKRDKDKDGVPDKYDLCPFTPKGVVVDSVGCPLDTDGDGVPDYLDECPDTPQEAYGKVDAVGCPIDSDGDGVPDYLDQCPNTPQGVEVDSVGCPIDSDGDGVPDYLDQCPNTPQEAYGKVDNVGCPLDSDGDGVPDYLDQCPETPQGVEVDSVGCPLDSDGDGVPDYLDQCPDTPQEAYGKVDSIGCPLDTDGDGVPDYLDRCPEVPGVAHNDGCPELKKEVTRLFTKALQGVQFASGKDVLLKSSYPILNDIARVMKENPDYLLTVSGHTDNVGDPVKNLDLSERRAQSVVNYLKKQGVESSRMDAAGYGDTKPIADNATKAGRELNRRVEFTVTFKVTTFE